MNSKKRDLKHNYIKLTIIFLLLLVISVTISASLAWFSSVRKIQTATLIDVPDIYIEGPNGETSKLLDLGDIDVTNGNSREYVFRVVAERRSKYCIQIAYTTNMPFTYEIYPVNSNETDKYVEVGGKYYYYNEPLNGEYLDKNVTKLLTYNDDDKVQKDASPQYWQSNPVIQEDAYYCYVLQISWNNSLINNKETDMVYLTVKTVDR